MLLRFTVKLTIFPSKSPVTIRTILNHSQTQTYQLTLHSKTQDTK